MHSSRMRTACSSSRQGVGVGLLGGGVGVASSPSTSPLVVGLDQIPLNFPLGCGPGPNPPQLPPWLWAWTRSPQLPPPGTRHPPAWTRYTPLWTEFLTHATQNIILPQTSFAGGKKGYLQWGLNMISLVFYSDTSCLS